MARPEKWDDLPAHALSGKTLFRTEPLLGAYPTVHQYIVSAQIEAQRLGLIVEEWEVAVPLTDEEKDRKLATAQAEWDNGLSYYQEVTGPEGDGFAPDEWMKRSALNAYTRAEDLPSIPQRPKNEA